MNHWDCHYPNDFCQIETLFFQTSINHIIDQYTSKPVSLFCYGLKQLEVQHFSTTQRVQVSHEVNSFWKSKLKNSVAIVIYKKLFKKDHKRLKRVEDRPRSVQVEFTTT